MAKAVNNLSILALCSALLLTGGTVGAQASTSPVRSAASVVDVQTANSVISAAAPTISVTRVSGADRYATAVAIS